MTDNESTEANTEVVAAAASVTDGAYTLFVADFADTEHCLGGLRGAQGGGGRSYGGDRGCDRRQA